MKSFQRRGAQALVRSSVLLMTAGLLLVSVVVQAAERRPAMPSARDKCPVCGMFVAKFPDFLAQIASTDGSIVFFDGVKDMFKYYFDPKRYSPGQRAASRKTVYVTDYYSLTPIDGFKAWYVIGSDVYGPMGRELIPFASEAEAREFAKDHKGQRPLRFQEITAAMVKGLDR